MLIPDINIKLYLESLDLIPYIDNLNIPDDIKNSVKNYIQNKPLKYIIAYPFYYANYQKSIPFVAIELVEDTIRDYPLNQGLDNGLIYTKTETFNITGNTTQINLDTSSGTIIMQPKAIVEVNGNRYLNATVSGNIVYFDNPVSGNITVTYFIEGYTQQNYKVYSTKNVEVTIITDNFLVTTVLYYVFKEILFSYVINQGYSDVNITKTFLSPARELVPFEVYYSTIRLTFATDEEFNTYLPADGYYTAIDPIKNK